MRRTGGHRHARAARYAPGHLRPALAAAARAPVTVRASRENFPLLAELLAEQQRLDTPVARFSSAHAAGARPASVVVDSQLIPLTAPGPGEQYAFQVDLDSCSGCKSCVAACHSLNGLEENETWRDVGLLVSPRGARPLTQTVTTACHHCADPACLNGCPVLAYEKDPVTGIVLHLDDQCMGCSYCILKCPYDVPKFSQRLGIVRKCDMCHGRLTAGEAPACAAACPTQAIHIVNVTRSEIRHPDTLTSGLSAPGSVPVPAGRAYPGSGFLPGAPDPHYTQPTTRYVSRRALPADLAGADAATLRPQPPHWPLVALLVMMPMAVGCGVLDAVLAPPAPTLTLLSWFSGAAGLACSGLHLGRPLRAWRVFLGWRKSWLSREAIVFGAWFPLATLEVAVRLDRWRLPYPALGPWLAPTVAAVGALGLFCSVMIYVDTRRLFWRFGQTAPRFFGTAVVLGLASALAVPGSPAGLGVGVALATMAKLLFEARAFEPLAGDRDALTPARKSALLLAGPLRGTNEARVLAALGGGVLLPLMVAFDSLPAAYSWPALGALLLGELLERSLFFRGVDAPKMPGVAA